MLGAIEDTIPAAMPEPSDTIGKTIHKSILDTIIPKPGNNGVRVHSRQQNGNRGKQVWFFEHGSFGTLAEIEATIFKKCGAGDYELVEVSESGKIIALRPLLIEEPYQRTAPAPLGVAAPAFETIKMLEMHQAAEERAEARMMKMIELFKNNTSAAAPIDFAGIIKASVPIVAAAMPIVGSLLKASKVAPPSLIEQFKEIATVRELVKSMEPAPQESNPLAAVLPEVLAGVNKVLDLATPKPAPTPVRAVVAATAAPPASPPSPVETVTEISEEAFQELIFKLYEACVHEWPVEQAMSEFTAIYGNWRAELAKLPNPVDTLIALEASFAQYRDYLVGLFSALKG
jgi:hypothetical protein